jgi:hypothetical protein
LGRRRVTACWHQFPQAIPFWHVILRRIGAIVRVHLRAIGDLMMLISLRFGRRGKAGILLRGLAATRRTGL